eukprot:351934-Chlamydomonas_euryale.AAC.13
MEPGQPAPDLAPHERGAQAAGKAGCIVVVLRQPVAHTTVGKTAPAARRILAPGARTDNALAICQKN